MKTGWKTAVVVMAALAVTGGRAVAGQGGPGWGRGPARGRGPGMGPGMGMGMGMRMGPGMGMQMGPGMGMQMGPGMGMRMGMGPCVPGMMGPARADALGAIVRRLDLTGEQKTQIRKIREDAKPDAETAAKAVADARDALHDAVTGGATEEQIRAAAATLGEAIGNQAALHAKTLAAVKAVLTDEQRKELDKIMANLPGPRQRVPHRPGPFCPWVNPNGPDAPVQVAPRGQGLGGGPVPTEQIFKAADTDKDGRLTLEEFEAFHNRPRGGWRFQNQ
jgi:Spy/CpxP family protein refolding chaperone